MDNIINNNKMNKEQLETNIAALELLLSENSDKAASFKAQLEKEKQQLEDYNKPELTSADIANIETNVEEAVEGFDFSNTDNYEFEFGMDYDGKVYVESIGLQCTYELTERVVKNVCKLFKEAELPEDDNS
tara:strand:- start:1 stop:393 length:393 start_codon:yes stop_codon:yes gene_type:complete